jgi:hypothetical protein
MKSRKVLLGLFAGLAMCFVGTATAQNANYQNNNLVEIGPDNIGGRVTSLVIFGGGSDNPATIYAGAATGGLFTRSDDQQAIYHEFTTFAELDRFYKGGVQYINQCLNEGWSRKDALDWDAYEAALEALKPRE